MNLQIQLSRIENSIIKRDIIKNEIKNDSNIKRKKLAKM